MVEQQMRTSIKMIGDFWYTAWIDVAKPDLKACSISSPRNKGFAAAREELEQS